MPPNGIFTIVRMLGPTVDRLLVASSTADGIWMIDARSLATEKAIHTDTSAAKPWKLGGFSDGGAALRFYRCGNPRPPIPPWHRGEITLPPAPPGKAPPPYRCGSLVVMDVPSARGPPPRQRTLRLNIQPFAGPPVFGPGRVWINEQEPNPANPVRAVPVLNEYDSLNGKKLRTILDPGFEGVSTMVPLAEGGLLYAAVKSVPSRKDWGSLLLRYPPTGDKPLRGTFIRGCTFDSIRLSPDGRYAAGVCTGTRLKTSFDYYYIYISKAVAVFFRVTDLKIVNVVQLNKRFDGAGAAIEDKRGFLTEAIADHADYIRILRMHAPRRAK
ncbi:MAG: hypothetical protein ACRD2E_00620 [Terriglobales bacterium]